MSVNGYKIGNLINVSDWNKEIKGTRQQLATST
jgi:hypothetical protein